MSPCTIWNLSISAERLDIFWTSTRPISDRDLTSEGIPFLSHGTRRRLPNRDLSRMEKFVPPVSHFPTEDFFLRWKILRSEKKFRGRKKQHKNEKQTQGREEQRSSLPWVICNDWMNASSIFFLLILLFENGAKGYAKGYPQAQPDPYSGSALNTLVKAMLQRITMTIPMRILMAIFFRGLSFPTQICNDLRKQSTVFVKGPAVKKPMYHCGRWGPPCRRRTRRRWRGPPSRS